MCKALCQSLKISRLLSMHSIARGPEIMTDRDVYRESWQHHRENMEEYVFRRNKKYIMPLLSPIISNLKAIQLF